MASPITQPIIRFAPIGDKFLSETDESFSGRRQFKRARRYARHLQVRRRLEFDLAQRLENFLRQLLRPTEDISIHVLGQIEPNPLLDQTSILRNAIIDQVSQRMVEVFLDLVEGEFGGGSKRLLPFTGNRPFKT